MVWFCCEDMINSLGYLSASDSCWLIHLSFQTLMFSPSPTFHLMLFWITNPCCDWLKACFRSLHQTDCFAEFPVSSRFLDPPYFEFKTLVHSSPFPCINCNFQFPSSARLNVSISLMPNPPFSFGIHTDFHLIHAILLWSSPPPHKKLRCSFKNLSVTDFGTLFLLKFLELRLIFI